MNAHPYAADHDNMPAPNDRPQLRAPLELRVEALEDRLAPATFRFGGSIFQPLRIEICCP